MLGEPQVKRQGSYLRKILSMFLSLVLVAACGVPPTAFASEAASASEFVSGAESSSETNSPVDITDKWRAGGLALSDAGTYILTDDVEVNSTLVVNAAESETIVLDFKGHTATVRGSVYAGIDTSGSAGTVIVKDSSYDEKAVEAREKGVDEPVPPSARLVVQANKVDDAVCGILGRYVAQASGSDETDSAECNDSVPVLEIRDVGIEVNLNTVSANTAVSKHDAYGIYLGYANEQDERTRVDALFDNCSIAVKLNNIELAESEQVRLRDTYAEQVLSVDQTGVSYGVYTTVPGIELQGPFSSTTNSANNTCDLFSTVEDAFLLSNSFEPSNPLRVYAAGNQAGKTFASVSDVFDVDDSTLSLFESALDSGTALKKEDSLLKFASSSGENRESTESAMDEEDNADNSTNSLEYAESSDTERSEESESVDSAVGGILAVAKNAIRELFSPSAFSADPAPAGRSVAYDPNGGSGEAQSFDLPSDATSAVAKSAAELGFSREGYAFDGWNTAADGSGEPYAERASVPLAGDLTLYAQWRAHPWLVGGSLYASFDDAQTAVSAGGTILLVSDLAEGEGVSFSKGVAGESYVIDLGGHSLGGVVSASPADVSMVSTGSRAVLRGYGKVGANSPVGIEQAGSGTLSVEGIDIGISTGSPSAASTGAKVSGPGRLVLDGVDVDVDEPSAKAGASFGLWLTAAGGSAEIRGGSIRVSVGDMATATNRGVWSQSAGSVSLEGVSVEVSADGGTAVGAAANAGTLSVIGGSVSAASGKGAAYGVHALGTKGASVFVSAASVSALAAEGAPETARYAAYNAGKTDGAATSVSLDGACSVSSAGAAELFTERFPFTAGASLSLPEGSTLRVAAPASLDFAAEPFAVAAADGVDLASKAPLFVPAAGSAYEGKAASFSEAAGGLVWADPAPAGTWSVYAVDGSPVGSFDSFDEAQEAVPDGGSIVLGADLEDVQVAGAATGAGVVFEKGGAGEAYAVDLAGHSLGGFVSKSAADVSVVSTGSRAQLKGYGAVSANKPVGVEQAGPGSLSVEGVDVSISVSGQSAEDVGARVSSTGSLRMEGVTVTVIESESRNTATYGVHLTNAGGSASLEDCRVHVSQSSAVASAVRGAYSQSAGSLAMQGCTVEVESAAGSIDAAAANAGALYVSGSTIFATASGASATACGMRALGSVGARVEARASTVSAQAAEGADASGMTLYAVSNAGSKDGNLATFVLLDGACSLSSGGSAELYTAKSPFAAGASLSLSEGSSLRVAAPSSLDLTAVPFAVAGEGCDLASKAPLFVPAAGSAYEGKVASFSEAAGGLVWADPAPAGRSVVYEPNGGSGEARSFDLPSDATSAVAKPASELGFSREGYAFSGWNTAADGSGEPYAEGATVPLAGDLTLYAQWRAGEVSQTTITFRPLGDRSGQISYSGVTGDPIDIGVDDSGSKIYLTEWPSQGAREGYEFVGWYRYGDAEETLIKEPPTVFPAENVIYVGKWQRINPEESETPSVENKNLYDLLTNADGSPKTGNVELTEQGTYYLSQSVEGFTGHLVIDKRGSYDIDLRGNSITFGTGREEGIITGGHNISIGTTDGRDSVEVIIRSTDGSGQEIQGGLSFVNGGRLKVDESASLALRNVDVSKRFTLVDKLTSYAGQSAIDMGGTMGQGQSQGQNLLLDSCSVELDCSNQVAGGASKLSSSTANAVTAICVHSANLAGLDIKNSTVAVKAGKPAKKEGEAQQNADAVALFVRAEPQEGATASVADSTLSATAVQGSAYALINHSYYKANAALVLQGGGVTLEASGAGEGSPLSIGLLNTVGEYGKRATNGGHGTSATLDTKLTFNSGASTNAFALASDQARTAADEAPFAMGPGFSGGSALPVLIGLVYDFGTGKDHSDTSADGYPVRPTGVAADANAANACIASFGFDASDEQKASAAGMLSNGVVGSKTFPSADGDGIRFTADVGDAEAYIMRDGAVQSFGTFEAATADMKSGETVVLARNLNRIVSFGATDEEKAEANGEAEEGRETLSYQVDLAGHVVGKLVCQSNAEVEVLTSRGDSQPALAGIKAKDKNVLKTVAVEQAGEGALTLNGLRISLENVDTEACGAIVSSGTLRLVDADVSVDAVTGVSGDICGVQVSGGSLEAEGGSVSVRQSSDTCNATGVAVARDGASAALSGCAVTVQGKGGTLAAATVANGAFDAKAGQDGAPSKLAVEGLTAAAAAYGVKASGAAAVGLDSCEVAVEAAEGSLESVKDAADAWDVYALTLEDGGAVLSPNPTVTLSGACTFKHFDGAEGTHVRHAENALSVNDDFSLASDGVSRLNVQSESLTDDVFASPAQEDGTLAGKEGLFAPVENRGNQYTGWSAKAKGTSLAWATDDVARIEDTGQTYASLVAAVNAATAGSTVTLMRDAATGELAVGKDLVLDLAGRTLSITSLGTQAVSVGGGRLTVRDSAESGGELKMSLLKAGADNFNYLREDGYGDASCKGFKVQENAALTLDGCSVRVGYAGSATTPAVSGIYSVATAASDGEPSVLLKGGAKLAVSSAQSALDAGGEAFSAFGAASLGNACRAYGVYFGNQTGNAGVGVGERANTLSVEAGSSIDATNSGSFVEKESADPSKIQTGDGICIREFKAEEDTALYQQILEKFKVSAQFDGSKGDGSPGAKYNARVYYAAPMELDDGTRVWAFSKPVSDDEVGKPESIVPAKMYLASTYDVSPDAVGVGSGRGGKGIITVSGEVSATSAQGNAYALQPVGETTWNVEDGARLSASTQGSGAYREIVDSAPDLKKELNISVAMGSNDFNFYGSVGIREVVESRPEAVAVAERTPGKIVDGVLLAQPTVNLNGKASYGVSGESSAALNVDQVTVGSGFASDVPLTTADKDGETKEGRVFARAAEGAEGAAGAIAGAQRDAFADATGAFDPVLSADGSNLSWARAYTISFVDFYGNVVSMVSDVQNGHTVALPSADKAKRDDSETRTYPLLGWSTDPAADPYDEIGSANIVPVGDSFVFAAPEGSDSKDVAYYAIYGEEPKPVQVTFENAKDRNGAAQDPVKVEAGAGESLGAEAASQTPAASDYGTWRFVGWRTLVTENNGITELGASKGSTYRVIDPQELANCKIVGDATLTAYYVNVASDQQLAVFKVDDYLFAYAVDDGSYPSYRAALVENGEQDSTVLNSNPTKKVEGQEWQFAGWHDGYDGSRDPYPNKDFDPSSLVNEAAAGADAAYYTAVFTLEGSTNVTITMHYYNEWKKGTWSYNEKADPNKQDQATVPFDTDVNAQVTIGANLKDGKAVGYVEKKGDEYRAHEFLGWSTRPTDKSPLENLPKAGRGVTNYYAIYSDKVMDVAVSFMVPGSEEALSIVSVPSDGALESALQAEGYLEPEAPDGKVFAGWSDKPDATAADAITSPGTAKLASASTFVAPANGDGKTEGAATYYAVFADAPLMQVTLHGNTDDGWTDKELSAEAGKPLDTAGYTAPWKKGYAFVGWNDREDGTGRSFDLVKDSVGDADLELWAQYVPIRPVVGSDDGTSVNVSGAYVNKASALGADDAAASLAKAASVDGVLATLNSDYQAIQTYALTLTVAHGEEQAELNDGFGALELTMPVPAAYADREVVAFLVGSDGKLQSAKCAVNVNGPASTATASVANYGSSRQGNLVLAYALTSEERSLNSAKAQFKQQLQNAYDAYSQDDYTGDEGTGTWGELTKAFKDGLAAVDAAASVTAAQTAAQAASDAMASVQSKSSLAQAKANALQRLAEAYAGYSKGDYTADNWSALTAAYNSAKSAIGNAQTNSDANKAASDGIMAMGNVQSGGGSGGTTSGLSSSGTTSGLTSSTTSGLSSGTSSGLSSSTGASGGLETSGLSSSSSSPSSSMMGAQLETLTAERAVELETSMESGVYVSSVNEGGPAEKAGIEQGDVIVAADGQEVVSLEGLDKVLSEKKAGDSVEIEVDRNGERHTFTVTLDEASALGVAGLTSFGDSNGRAFDDGVGGEPTGLAAVQKWIGDNLVLVCVLALVLLAAVSGLVWWMLRRRNRAEGGEDDDDFWEEDEEEGVLGQATA